MIAVDTNILVYAHRRDSAFHESAADQLKTLTDGRASWAIPWPCMHEFLAIVTHPRIYSPPTPLAKAIDQATAWMESPQLTLIGESEKYWPSLISALEAGKISGAAVHDARIAAICLEHGIREIWSADRDFSRFPALKARNPLRSR